MRSDIFLSVVVTALNEESNVETCVSKLNKFLSGHFEKYEIIFVNDGSTDKTKERLDAIAGISQLKVIHLENNHGTGGAIKKAIPFIEGEWYCWLPSDLEILPEEILKPLALASQNDVIITYIENGHVVRSDFRNTLSKLFVKVMNLSFGKELKYFNGVSLIKTSLMKDLNINSNRFFFHAELLLKVLLKTKKFDQVAITLTPRTADVSKAIKAHVLADVIVCFIRNFWELRIIHENPDY